MDFDYDYDCSFGILTVLSRRPFPDGLNGEQLIRNFFFNLLIN